MRARLEVARALNAAAILSMILLTGCVAAAAAGAGSAIYLTSRGAESIVDANMSQVASAVRATFESEGIPINETESNEGGEEREIQGTKGDVDVLVRFERQDANTTKVEVAARKNVAVWDKDYAKRILEQIVRRS